MTKPDPLALSPDTIDMQFCSDYLKDEIRAVFKERDELRAQLALCKEALRAIADADYRGNRSSESVMAFEALAKLEGEK